MPNVYAVSDTGSTAPLLRIRCKDEDRELQTLLSRNYDLLPGEQINPDNPCRWLLVRREMPVPDSGTGANRWSMDFFFLDQDAMPTFVECKRFDDTRSRREVVGQMLDYAANGKNSWSSEHMFDAAAKTASAGPVSLDEAVSQLRPVDGLSVEGFFQRAAEKLRQGEVRLVFFLEEAPNELKSVVEFLNKQMESSEVLLVEARQYVCEGTRIVTPVLFGYTEQARMIKKAVVGTAARRKWDHDSFFEEAASKLPPSEVAALAKLYERAAAEQCDLNWGTGKENGSYSIVEASIAKRSLLSAYTDGRLEINFGWLREPEKAAAARDRMKTLLESSIGLSFGDDYRTRYPGVRASEWVPKVDELLAALSTLLAEFRAIEA